MGVKTCLDSLAMSSLQWFTVKTVANSVEKASWSTGGQKWRSGGHQSAMPWFYENKINTVWKYKWKQCLQMGEGIFPPCCITGVLYSGTDWAQFKKAQGEWWERSGAKPPSQDFQGNSVALFSLKLLKPKARDSNKRAMYTQRNSNLQ